MARLAIRVRPIGGNTLTNHFQALGRALIDNGYLIVPIAPGGKRPLMPGWQAARMTASDLHAYPGHGVGILCGQGDFPIAAIDIDISHPAINEAVVAWCQSHFGCSAERVGAAPRTLLVYRAATSGWTKGSSIKFFDDADPQKLSGKVNEQQVEVLGLGQQFVAYHLHPDTGKEYEWTDLFGGIAHIPAHQLPIITDDQIDALIAEVDRLVRITPGLKVVSRGASVVSSSTSLGHALESLTPRLGVPLSEVRDAMAFYDNSGNGQGYETWLSVGMALHHEYGNTERDAEALALWKEWGSKSDKHDPKQYDYKWFSFEQSGRRPTTLRWLLKMVNQAKRDVELIAKRDTVEAIKTAIADAQDIYALTSSVADRIRNLVGDDTTVQNEAVSTFRRRYKELSGSATLTVTQAKSLILPKRADSTPTVLTQLPLTEFGNAKRMVNRYRHEMIYVPEINCWFLWTGQHWRKAAEIEVEFRAKQTVIDLVDEAKNLDSEKLPEFFEFCKYSQQVKMVVSMKRLAASDPDVMVPVGSLDSRSHLLGVRNGVVDLSTGVFRQGRQDDYITMRCGCDYIPNATSPLFDQTLIEVFKGDREMADFFMVCIGYALTGNPTQDMLFIPFGSGSNGKSTILGVIRRVFGDYAKSAEASTFVADGKSGGAGGAREDLVRLRGSRFVYVNEPDEGGELREGMVKSMTGGDSITARALYSRDSVEITPSWVVFMPTNHKPIIKGNDNGIWRRLTLIPFERNFENDPTVAKDPKREEKLLAEMPGVLNRCLQAAMRYQREGLNLTSAVRAARDDYRSQMDLLAEWLDECCELDSTYSEDMAKLWSSWDAFAKRNGLHQYVRSSVALGKRLDHRFAAFKGTGGVRKRQGLRIKDVFRMESVTQSGASGG